MSSLVVLEATIVCIIMLSAVTYVSTYDVPPSGEDVVEDSLERRLDDIFRILEDVPTPNLCGDDLLESLVIDTLGGNTDIWDNRVRAHLPRGVVANLYLDNLHERYPLRETYEFQGIGRSTMILPIFSGAEAMTATSVSSGSEHLHAETVAVHHGHLVSTRGEAVRFSVGTSGVAARTYEGWGLTALLDANDSHLSRHAIGNLSWRDGSFTEEVMLSHDAPSAPRDVLHLRLNLSAQDDARLASEVFPEELRVQVRLPEQWPLVEDSVRPPHWQPDEPWLRDGYWEVNFSATEPLAHSDTLRFNVKRPSDAPLPTVPYEVISARLGNGSLSESHLVLDYALPGAERDLPRLLYPTVPYPLRPNQTALFGLAFANGGTKTEITTVDIEIPGGYDVKRHGGKGAPLFRNVTPTNKDGETDGTWSWVGPRHVQWTGSRNVSEGAATFWAVEVAIAGPEAATSVEPSHSNGVESRITFPNGVVSTSRAWGQSPGILHHRIAPATYAPAELANPEALSHANGSAGYPWLPYATTVGFDGRVQGAGATQDASGSYRLGAEGADLTRLDSALQASRFAVRNRLAPLGSTQVVSANLESLVEDLATKGVTDFNISVDLYAPPAIGCAPTRTWTSDSGSLPLGSVHALDVWAPDGVQAAYLTGADGNVHRVDPGVPLSWTRSIGAAGTTLARVTPAVGVTSLAVGDVEGNVRALNPTTGDILWSHRVALDPAVVATTDEVTSLTFDAGSEQLLVGTQAGVIELLDSADGERTYRQTLPGRVLQANVSGAEVWTLTPGNLTRHDASLQWQASLQTTAFSFTRASQGIFVTDSRWTIFRDPAWFAPLVQHQHAKPAMLASHGDVDGDGVVDHLVAQSDLRVLAFSGATGALLWNRETPIRTSVQERAETVFGSADVVEWGGCEAEPGYPELCVSAPDVPLGLPPDGTPLVLRVVDGVGIVLVFKAYESVFVELMDLGGGTIWQQAPSPRRVPTVATAGAWGTSDAVVLGNVDGTVSIRHAATGAPAPDRAPSAFTGRFSVAFSVPSGGFFGTHLVVARVGWTEGGVDQQVSLTDWFTVVNEDGAPNLTPGYRVVIMVEDPGTPYRDG